MATICPAVLAKDAHEFRDQMERIAHFAERIQIDLTDGLFARTKTVSLNHVWWPHSIPADLHMMYERPDLYLEQILKLEPHMVIVHAEAEGQFVEFARALHDHSIKVGVALLPDTHPELIEPALEHVDHVLIFSGHLGHFGGHADLGLLEKVKLLKTMKPEVEIGWDGGISADNAQALAANGVDVLNVGGHIQKAADPEKAYNKLVAKIEAPK
jgi:ribulose-phosphate 3-epimerase